MKRDQDFANWHREKIREYISKSYARKLLPEEDIEENDCIWYLPHFALSNANKGNKRRLVFDATATVDGVSFNSTLIKHLLSILFKFRQGRIRICANIREMFHRIEIL